MNKYNLIIFHKPRWQQISDFVTIKDLILVRAPEIEVFIVTPTRPLPVDFWLRRAERPTALFASTYMEIDPVVRGARLIPTRMTKFEEIEALARNGFPVPEAQLIAPDTSLGEAEWGPFVVIKPNRGNRGRGVRLERTKDVCWADTALLPKDDPWHGKKLVAQRYINTGPYPKCYRVMTVFGKAVYSISSISLEKLPPLASGLPVSANGQARKVELSYDEEVINLAQEIHSRLTHTPVMGIDIICDFDSGKLYALELNSGGLTWHISSDYGLRQQRKYGLDHAGQFGALDIIAERLVNATLRFAV